VPPEIADTIIATIIYFTATSVLFSKFWDKVGRRRKEREQSRTSTAGEVKEAKHE
jgi:simple sugar transport system permease protein